MSEAIPGYADSLDTPFGPLATALNASGAVIECIFLHSQSVDDFATQRGLDLDPARCRQAVRQLDDYFHGSLRQFDVPVAPAGTPFQLRVWAMLRTIPYGTTTTYGALARRLGNPTAIRAVGRANGANPIGIVIPCHRVIGADGSLTGYAGGLNIKRALLELEAAQSSLSL